MLLQVLNVEEGNTTSDRSASNVNTDLRGCVYVCMYVTQYGYIDIVYPLQCIHTEVISHSVRIEPTLTIAL